MRASSFPLSLFLLAVVFGTVGCGSTRPSQAAGSAVATVNGEPLSNAAFERFVTVKLGDFASEPLNDTVRSELLDEFVKREVAAQAAVRRGLSVPVPAGAGNPEAEMVLSEQAIDSLVDRYYCDVVLKDVRVTPEEVASYYDTHRAAYAGAAGYYVREIRVRTRGDAEQARQTVLSGCEFAEVARAVSTAATAAHGGLAYYDARALPPAFARVIARLAVGRMSDVVRSDLGYHIFLLERRGSARSPDRVADDVRANKNERLVEADMERLLGESSVTINREYLPFQYEGRFAQ